MVRDAQLEMEVKALGSQSPAPAVPLATVQNWFSTNLPQNMENTFDAMKGRW